MLKRETLVSRRVCAVTEKFEEPLWCPIAVAGDHVGCVAANGYLDIFADDIERQHSFEDVELLVRRLPINTAAVEQAAGRRGKTLVIGDPKFG